MGMKPADSDLSHCDMLNLDEKYNCQRLKHVKFIYEGQSKITADSYLLCRLTYTSEIWHMHAMNCPASEYAIYKTMQSIDCCCLGTEECEITSYVHAGI